MKADGRNSTPFERPFRYPFVTGIFFKSSNYFDKTHAKAKFGPPGGPAAAPPRTSRRGSPGGRLNNIIKHIHIYIYIYIYIQIIYPWRLIIMYSIYPLRLAWRPTFVIKKNIYTYIYIYINNNYYYHIYIYIYIYIYTHINNTI